MKKQWIKPKRFEVHEVDSKTCIVPPYEDKESFILTENKNQNQIHHNLRCPTEYNEQGKFEIQWKSALTGSINLQLGDDGGHSYSFYMDMYGKWSQWYQEATNIVDTLLARITPQTKPDELKALLFEGLGRRGFKLETIQASYDLNMPRGFDMTPDLFRQMALHVLLHDKMDKDPVGSVLMRFCVELKRLYCADLDKPVQANQRLKGRIYSLCGIPDNMVDKPAAELVNDVYKWSTHPKEHPLSGKIDYSKSPSIPFKIHDSKPKPNQNTQGKVAYPTGQVKWTSTYDYLNRSLADATTAITTYDEWCQFTYVKGDSAKGKAAFRLMQSVVSKEPTVFWGQVQKRATFQFKVEAHSIFRKLPYGGGSRALSVNDAHAQLADAQAAMQYFGILNEPAYDPNANDGGDDFDNYNSDPPQGQKRTANHPDDNERETKRANLFEKL